MNKFGFAFRSIILIGLFFASSAIADGQAARTWVSGLGDDANVCSRTLPCKTFAIAMEKTSSNGEVNCLDPGSYGWLTITKSITIDCEDTQGSILAAGTTGVTVNGTNIDVRLRGISIDGAATGINCIRVINSGNNRLTLDEVVCSGFTQHGVSIESSGGTFRLVALNSSFRNNTGNGINTFLTGGATAAVSVTGSLFAFNGIGINLGLSAIGTITDSTITNNVNGVQASGSTSVMALKGCTITHNTTGVLASSSATVRIGGNMITGNSTGLSGSNIFTWGGNFVDGNTPGGNGSNNGAAIVQ